ncbi:hypothetical protein AC578_3544 [Pseudocercospora eumusae]|uniref:BTB domain-containing protein n=1 Tax=Pseudocercospora eumusae TaxID=321146 RepID=A0A139GW56_9PEZI|nr:hypothetical protein AC578_3544 [Pseudocercospora eumusae]
MTSTSTPNTSEMATLPSTPDQQPSRSDLGTIVQITVGQGDGAQTFRVFKGSLRFYSGYFRTAIEDMERSHASELQLPHDEPETFDLFRRWLYTRELPPVGDPASRDGWARLFKLWCFGARRNIPLLQNETMDTISRWMEETCTIPTAGLCYVWENTTKGALLRTFLVKTMWARFKGAGSLIRSPERYSPEVMYDMLLYGLENRPVYQRDPTRFEDLDPCEWHLHEEGVRCKDE